MCFFLPFQFLLRHQLNNKQNGQREKRNVQRKRRNDDGELPPPRLLQSVQRGPQSFRGIMSRRGRAGPRCMTPSSSYKSGDKKPRIDNEDDAISSANAALVPISVVENKDKTDASSPAGPIDDDKPVALSRMQTLSRYYDAIEINDY